VIGHRVLALARRARDDEAGNQLLLGAAGTVGLNAAFVVLNLLVVLVLTRLLCPRDFGAYASAYAWAGLLAVLAVLGLTPLVVRQVASYRAARSWDLLRGLLRRTSEWVGIASATTVAVAAVGGWFLYRGRPELLHPFWLALLLVPLTALVSLRQAAMQGLGRVVVGRIPETIVLPALFLAFVAVAAFGLGDDFDARWATAAHVAAAACTFAFGALLLRRSLPRDVGDVRPAYDLRSWRRSGASLVLLNVVLAANAQLGTILLGALASPEDAGVFNVAVRATGFISFTMLAASYPLMPLVARLYAAGEVDRLQRAVLRTARVLLLVAVPTALLLVALAPTVLAVFGAGFEAGATSVRLLAIGEVVNVVTGFGGLVLVMTGHERDLARSVALGAAVNLALTAALIPIAGVEGAAIGTATGIALSNVVMARLAWKRLGVWTTVARLRLRAPLP
jgi:O-antigen/teichoic acid export membrane protein